MNYPEYRRQGLPVTTAWMESLVKEMNYRVKGTEMFWNDPEGAEAILQVRAAALCDDERLVKHLRTRPGHPFTRRPKVPQSDSRKKSKADVHPRPRAALSATWARQLTRSSRIMERGPMGHSSRKDCSDLASGLTGSPLLFA